MHRYLTPCRISYSMIDDIIMYCVKSPIFNIPEGVTLIGVCNRVVSLTYCALYKII